jgi:dsRNA-specific ribonuclease
MQMIQLGLLTQKKFKKNLKSKVIGQTGADHCPIITVEIELPNGKKFTGTGGSQIAAKEKLAKEILLKEFGYKTA